MIERSGSFLCKRLGFRCSKRCFEAHRPMQAVLEHEKSDWNKRLHVFCMIDMKGEASAQ